MIRHELQTSVIRFYNSDSSYDFADYDAICTLIWETSEVVWIKGLHGNLNYKLLREFIQLIDSLGAKTIKAYRADNRKVPFTAKRNGNLVEIDVATIMRRVGKTIA